MSNGVRSLPGHSLTAGSRCPLPSPHLTGALIPVSTQASALLIHEDPLPGVQDATGKVLLVLKAEDKTCFIRTQVPNF